MLKYQLPSKLVRGAAVLLLCLAFGHFTQAQGSSGGLDVRSCFSDILVDRTINKNDVNVRYALQEQWSRDLWEQAKQSNTLALWIDGADISDTYEATNAKRLKEMYMKSVAYDFSDHSSLYRASLNSDAKNVINKCLDTLAARRGIGLYWVPYVHNDDPTIIDLEFRFQYHPTSTPLHVTTKSVTNAVVTDNGGSHPKELFGFQVWHPINYNALMPYESRFVSLKRMSPGDTITIQITTDPNLSVPPITIEGEPKPQTCEEIPVTEDELKRPLHAEVGDLLTDDPKYRMFDSQGNVIHEGHGDSFKISIDLKSLYPPGTDFSSAIITNVRCSRSGVPEDYFEWTYRSPGLCCLPFIDSRPNDLVGVCRGWWELHGRKIRMAIDWQRSGLKCTPHDWKQEKGKWQ